jgi:[ribosomal protein S5]-alanine N-acetyltransferase
MTFSHQKAKIESERLVLRTLEQADASSRYVGWLNDPEVNVYLQTRSASIEDLKTYITKKNEVGDCLFFGIFMKENGEHVGNVKLEPIDATVRSATIGILIGEQSCWGKGIGTEVTRMMVDFAFNDLGMKEVNLGVLAANKAAIHVYEKCGFDIYQVDKGAIDHDGKKFDQIWMRILSSPQS